LVAALFLLNACDLAALTGGPTSFVASCTQVSATAAPPQGGATLTGRATNAAGQAVQGVTVLATDRASGTCTRVAAAGDGTYRLPLGSSAYSIYARADIQYAGNTWSLRLLPLDGDATALPARGDSTEDFILVRSCAELITCKQVNDRVGGLIRLAMAPGASIVWTEAHRIRLTLEPSGPLADGSASGAIRREVPSFRLEPSYQEPVWAVQDPPSPVAGDIPLGTYTATAIAETTAGDVPLVLSMDGASFRQDLPVAFAPKLPDYSGATGIADLVLTIRQ
jgi:hypothetical protein